MSKGTKCITTIVGRMGDAVKVRTSNSGKKIGSVRLAVTSGYGDNELTSWFDAVVFDEKKVEVLEKYTQKGSRILVIGEQRVRKWQKDGQDRYSNEVIVSFEGSLELMDSKSESSGGGQSSSGQSTRSGRSDPPPMGGGFGDLDDDVPF
jgi:single-strand DNA-binding protein